ncbi:DUF305 domain-containing protein [Actinomadura decatromicini]|uniref:DUF305 domain-containing protein n=1 Tax=Actinomadura decatromicini TaxID=2604572 RepID=A0A5D3FSP7_9ACTN|nr:DUF305 domain-containing protein [Actinomadura decatromicini]TYK51381.1 DUF305 domain-containing protein [Actinomadura decatromicini]
MTAKLPPRDGRATAPVGAAAPPSRLVLAATFFAFAVLLTACGGTSKASDPAEGRPKQTASADHNADDVMYLQMMIAHRRQMLDMVRLVPDRAKRAEVKKLAATLEKDSAGEVQKMTSWLTAWSKPTTMQGSANSHAAHGGMPAIGPVEMESLQEGKGRTFDSTFLNLLLGHQGNATEMSQVELKKGVNPTTRAFASDVVKRTSDMVSKLLGLLNS